MTVACKDEKCYYYDRGFCSNELTAIDKNGMCEAVWHNGQPRPQVKEGRRMPIHILNIVKRQKEFNEDEYVVPEEKETGRTECIESEQPDQEIDQGPGGDMELCEEIESPSEECTGETTEDNGADGGSDSDVEGEDCGDAGEDE